VQSFQDSVILFSPVTIAGGGSMVNGSPRISGFHSPDSVGLLVKTCAKASALGLVVRGGDLRVQVVNAAWAEINRMPADQHVGKSSQEFLGEMAAKAEPLLRAVVASKQSISSTFNGRLPRRPDHGDWLVRYYPAVDTRGHVQCVATFVIETTIEKRIEEALCLLDISALPTKEMQEWTLELQHSLDVFDFALHQTCRLLTDPQDCGDLTLESLQYRVEALDNRVHVLRKLLQNQADFLKDTQCPLILN
jgi:PAS domain-containing protein